MPKEKGLLDFAPDSNLLPRAYVVVKVEDTTIDESSGGKKRFGADCVIREPKELEGRHCYPRFIAGTGDDPTASDPENWKKNGFCRTIKQAVRKAGVESSDPDEAWQEMRGQLVGIFISQRPSNLTGELEQTYSFFKPGERDPEVLGDSGSGKPKAPVKPKAAAKETAEEEFELVEE